MFLSKKAIVPSRSACASLFALRSQRFAQQNYSQSTSLREQQRQVLEGLVADLESKHPIWTNPFFLKCNEGSLTKDDFKLALSQYFFFCRDFTRYLFAATAHQPNDVVRAHLSNNMYDEVGNGDIHKRHSKVFQDMLFNSFGINDPDSEIQRTIYADKFRDEFYQGTFLPRVTVGNESVPGALYSLVFMLGCEAIVPKYYTIVRDGMKAAGLTTPEVEFFDMHITCDEGHAASMYDVIFDLKDHLGLSFEEWKRGVELAIGGAATAKGNFFTACHDHLQTGRDPLDLSAPKQQQQQQSQQTQQTPKEGTNKKTTYFSTEQQGRGSLSFATTDINRDSLEPLPVYREFSSLIHRQVAGEEVAANYSNERRHPVYGAKLPTSNVSLSIGDVFPGEPTSNHRHAYESVLYCIEGEGYTVIEGQRLDWTVGDAIYVPPWNWHQHFCKGDKRVRYVLGTNLPILAALGQTVIREEEK